MVQRRRISFHRISQEILENVRAESAGRVTLPPSVMLSEVEAPRVCAVPVVLAGISTTDRSFHGAVETKLPAKNEYPGQL